MVIYECERCGYKVKHKHNFLKHLNRKRPCKAIISNIRFETLKEELKKKNIKTSTKCKHNVNIMSTKCQHNVNINDKINNKELTKLYYCNYCNKTFKYRQSKSRHEKTCIKKINDKSLIDFFSKKFNEIEVKHEKEKMQLEKEKAELRLQIEKLLEKVGNNNTTNTNNIQTQIVLNNFGKENVEYINSNYINKLIQQGIYAAVPKIIKYLHFNPEHPENRNVKITNKKETWAQIWNNDKWELKNKKLVISDIVDKGYNIIDDNKKPEDLNTIKKSKLNNFQEKYDSNDKETHKY